MCFNAIKIDIKTIVNISQNIYFMDFIILWDLFIHSINKESEVLFRAKMVVCFALYKN